MEGGFGLLARRLAALEGVQRALRLAHHAVGLGAAAADIQRVQVGLHGEAEAVHRVRVGGDDTGGEAGLESVGGVEGGDGGDRVFVAGGAVFRRVGDGRREGGGEGVEGVTGDGGREVGEGFGDLHG